MVIKILYDLRLVVEVSLSALIVGDTREQGLLVCHYNRVIAIELSDTDVDIRVEEALIVLLLPLLVLLDVLGIVKGLVVAVQSLLGLDCLSSMHL